MARHLISIDEFRKQLRHKRAGEDAVRTQTAGAVMKGEDGTVDIVISTEAVDRSKDVVQQDGWKLGNFQKNPIVLFAHESRSPPVARCGRLSIETNPGRLVAKGVEFTPKDMYPFGGMIGEMVKGGFLNAASVGFQPLKYAFNEGRGDWAVDFIEQELLEFSIVPVPANPEALVGAKAAGIDVGPMREWAERVLDGDVSRSGARRKQLEHLYRLASELVGKSKRAPSSIVREDGEDGGGEDMSQQCDCPDGALVKCAHCDGYVRMALPPPDADGDDDGDKALKDELRLTKAAMAGALKRLDALEAKAEPTEQSGEIARAVAEEVKRQVSVQLGRVD